MEVKINRSDLFTLLSRCIGVVPAKGPIVHVTHFLIEGQGNTLTVTGTDLGNTIVCRDEADVVSEGKAVVNARKFFDIVRELPEESIYIFTRENYNLSLKCASGNFMISGLDPEEFPLTPELKGKLAARIKGEELSHLIRRVLFAVSPPDLSVLASGALLEIKDNQITLVGTDGHRLAWIRRPVESDIQDQRVMVSRKVLVELKSIADDFPDNELILGFVGSFLVCSTEQTFFYGRLNEEEFPDYQAVIPQSPEKSLLISTESLIKALRRVVLLTDDLSHGVRMIFKDDLLALQSQDSDYGDANETVEIKPVNEEIKLVFNAAYVLEFLNVADVEEISIDFNSELSPCAFHLVGDEQYVCVIMPLQTEH